MEIIQTQATSSSKPIKNTATASEVSGLEATRNAHRIEDSVSISSESLKRAEWIQMLKEMPDIRSEKIEAARATFSPRALAAHLLSEI